MNKWTILSTCLGQHKSHIESVLCCLADGSYAQSSSADSETEAKEGWPFEHLPGLVEVFRTRAFKNLILDLTSAF